MHKDLADNTLYVGQGHDHPWLHSTVLQASSLHWITGHSPVPGSRLTAKVRYRQADQECTVTAIEGDFLELEFNSPQRAVTPGQSIVFYSDDVCIGGGIIKSALDD